MFALTENNQSYGLIKIHLNVHVHVHVHVLSWQTNNF